MIAMQQSYNMNERIWRVILFVLALLLITIVNIWQEAVSEGERRALVEEKIAHVRHIVQEDRLDLMYLSAEFMQTFEIADIPMLLEAIEHEDEQVGSVLCQIVSTIGELGVPHNTWMTTAEWKQIWNEKVQVADRMFERIIADQQLSELERAQRFIELGAPAIPHLIRHSASEYVVQEGAILALRSMLGESIVPEWRNTGERRVWAMRHQSKYSGLGYKFE